IEPADRLGDHRPSAAAYTTADGRAACGGAFRATDGGARSRNDPWRGLLALAGEDRSDLDRAPARPGNAPCHRDRLVEVLGLHEVVAAQLLSRLGKRPVRDQPLSFAHAHGGRRRGRPERSARKEVAAPPDAVGELSVIPGECGAAGLSQLTRL